MIQFRVTEYSDEIINNIWRSWKTPSKIFFPVQIRVCAAIPTRPKTAHVYLSPTRLGLTVFRTDPWSPPSPFKLASFVPPNPDQVASLNETRRLPTPSTDVLKIVKFVHRIDKESKGLWRNRHQRWESRAARCPYWLTRWFVLPLSTKICSSLMMNRLEGVERLARFIIVRLRIWAMFRRAVKIVLFVLTNSA